MDAPVINPPPTATTLDVAALTRVPILNLESYVSLIRNLQGVSFEDPGLDHARARLKLALEEGEQMLVARLGDEVDLKLERAFDYFTDRVWGFVHNELEFWSLYEHEGLGLLSAEQRAAIDWEQGRARAEVAGDLLERMFSRENADFLRRSFPQQAAAMRSRLQMVEDKGLSEEFAALVGPRLVTLIEVCQARYEAMIDERASRKRGPLGDRRVVNNKLRRALHLYALAVVGTLDDEDPESAERIERALRPITSVEAARRGGGGVVETDEVGEGGEDMPSAEVLEGVENEDPPEAFEAAE